MFHVKHEWWKRIAAELGRSFSPSQIASLNHYARWLREEAIPAGAIGSGERDRLEARHLIDSLLFLHGWRQSRDPDTVWDLGSGAGLPGIPLSIALPETMVTLVDRSGRRVDLLRRVIRILDLGNVAVLQHDFGDMEGTVSMMVSRATLGPERMGPLVSRHLQPNGVAVVGGSWVSRPQPPSGWEVEEIRLDSLDRTVWLLIMRG